MDSIKLTVKQKNFADIYIKSGNATQSYIDAGYKASSRNVAEANSSALLGNHKVKSYIDMINKRIQDESIAGMIEIKQFWTRFIREASFEDKDRLKASEYLAKTNGAFIDKIEHSGNINISERAKEIESKLFGDG